MKLQKKGCYWVLVVHWIGTCQMLPILGTFPSLIVKNSVFVGITS